MVRGSVLCGGEGAGQSLGERDREAEALLLVPEIALTPAVAGQFFSRFGDRVAILHSAFTDVERSEQWRRIRSGAPSRVTEKYILPSGPKQCCRENSTQLRAASSHSARRSTVLYSVANIQAARP